MRGVFPRNALQPPTFTRSLEAKGGPSSLGRTSHLESVHATGPVGEDFGGLAAACDFQMGSSNGLEANAPARLVSRGWMATGLRC